jgi:hypothetical protein
MLEPSQTHHFDQLVELISEGSLDLGFIHGSGIGALLLAFLGVVFLRRPPKNQQTLLTILSCLPAIKEHSLSKRQKRKPK